MRSNVFLVALFMIIAGLAAQCGSAPAGQSNQPEIEVTHPYALAAIAGGNGAIYLELTNKGGSPDTLLRVESQAADAAEVHETKIDENDVMRMTPLTKLEIPVDGSVKLEPGGKHIMLVNLKHELKAGEKVGLTLIFANAGSLTVEAEVRAAGTAADHDMDHSEHNQ